MKYMVNYASKILYLLQDIGDSGPKPSLKRSRDYDGSDDDTPRVYKKLKKSDSPDDMAPIDDLPDLNFMSLTMNDDDDDPPWRSGNASSVQIEEVFDDAPQFNCDDGRPGEDQRMEPKPNQENLTATSQKFDMFSKVNNAKTGIELIEEKLKGCILGGAPEEVPERKKRLPKLNGQQEKLVSAALGPGPPDQLFIEKFNISIHRRDLQTLSDLKRLNGKVVNFYMKLLMQRSQERPDLPRLYVTNFSFYPQLLESGQASLRSWTEKVDIFSHALVAVPVYMGMHWCMVLLDMKARRVVYLDSTGGRNQHCVDALLQYLRDEHQDRKGVPFDDSGWTTDCVQDIPQQTNDSDCGMFACTFAEYSSRDAPYTFSQSDMPQLRRKAALEVLQGRLLI